MSDETAVYHERSYWAPWVYVLLWVALGSSILGLLSQADWAWPWGTPEWTATGLLAFGLALHRFAGGLTVRLHRNALWVGLGDGSLIRKKVAYEDIESLESVRYRPLREFGGWGIRGFGKKQAWTARGDQAVVLHLVSDRQLYIGSDRPQRLEERIRALAGDRLGAPGAGEQE